MCGQVSQDPLQMTHSRTTNFQKLPYDPSHPWLHPNLTQCTELGKVQQLETQHTSLVLSPHCTTSFISLPCMAEMGNQWQDLSAPVRWQGCKCRRFPRVTSSPGHDIQQPATCPDSLPLLSAGLT